MSVDNPYAAPEADLTVIKEAATDGDLADRGTRFVAAFLDSLIGIAYAAAHHLPAGNMALHEPGRNPPIGLSLAATALGFLAFLLIQGYFLMTNGQTVGKKITGIRIADLDGNVPDFGKLILRRYLPMSVAASIPVIGPYLSIVDVLFISEKIAAAFTT